MQSLSFLGSNPVRASQPDVTHSWRGYDDPARERILGGVLHNIAKSEGKTTNQIITELHDDAVMDSPDEAPRNFASVLRVSCCRYLEINGTTLREARPGVPPLELVRRR